MALRAKKHPHLGLIKYLINEGTDLRFSEQIAGPPFLAYLKESHLSGKAIVDILEMMLDRGAADFWPTRNQIKYGNGIISYFLRTNYVLRKPRQTTFIPTFKKMLQILFDRKIGLSDPDIIVNAAKSWPEIFRFVIETPLEADLLNVVDKKGDNILQRCFRESPHKENLHLLLSTLRDRGVLNQDYLGRLDSQGLSPLHHIRDLDLLRQFIEAGGDINLRSATGIHPLIHLINRIDKLDLLSMIELYSQLGARLNSADVANAQRIMESKGFPSEDLPKLVEALKKLVAE